MAFVTRSEKVFQLASGNINVGPASYENNKDNKAGKPNRNRQNIAPFNLSDLRENDR